MDQVLLQVLLFLGWIGLIGVVGISGVGSAIGCTRAGLAADGAMLETEGGHGKFLGLVALPSSQSILGIVLMFALRTSFVLPNGSLNANAGLGVFAIGILAGIALAVCAVYQGECCAMAINVSKSKPEIFGKTIVAPGIVEGFSIFVFVMALVLSQGLPKA